ncbi:threonine aldolase family protein [Fulvivirga lutea]|uniref:Threonine aldolase n=1 Tax=Fulvivirga lutea TaxID=2810512 RepID=A0A974WM05_9BACT|nr:GntG family PLP-dependent aldolase [Fulvivirga lutea]QSE97863.1 threonine aldolase [Fulvivirga lutea]
MIDLRSDTVTKPTPAMLDAMMSAEVGDDVFGEDPTILMLEKKAAEMLGCEAGIFCPSGTMTNQIGVHVLTQPYEEVICYQGSHIYKYEGGGVAGTSGLSFKLLDGDRGRINPKDVEAAINPDDIHYPISSLLSLENTVNKGGGSYYTLEEIKALHLIARQNNLKIHLDGARLFNALAETKERPTEYGQYFDTISICLSKGLGAPVGSMLVGKREYITKARRVRKFLGGGMRQAGYLAAAGIYALENNINRLVEDHDRAKQLGEALSSADFVKDVYPVETNIVIFKIKKDLSNEKVLQKFKENGLLAIGFGPDEIRMVTHLNFNDDQLEKAIQIIKKGIN